MLFGSFLILIALLATTGAAIYYKKVTQGKEKEVAEIIPPEILNSFNFFKEKVASLGKSLDMLEELVGEYFMTMNSSGHIQLSQIRNALDSSLMLCQQLLDEKDFNNLNPCLDFLVNNSGFGEVPEVLAKSVENIEVLSDWPVSSKELLASLEKSLNETSKKYKMIGRPKKRERQATDTVLGELRKTMIEVARNRGKGIPGKK